MTFETFEQFWKENYEKEYWPDTEPFYGIASCAWEMGKEREREAYSGKLVTALSLIKEIFAECFFKTDNKHLLLRATKFVKDVENWFVIDPCRMCRNYDDNKGFNETCSMCCWFYDSKFEVK